MEQRTFTAEYKMILDKGVQDTFPNVAIALRMYLVLMVTNCSAERSFSKLKLIENRLRTSVTQERLVNLAIMSIESDILREIDFATIIIDFVRKNGCLVFDFRLVCVGSFELQVHAEFSRLIIG